MTEVERLAGSAPALVPVGVIVAAGVVGAVFGLGTGLLVLAGGMLVLAITLFWSSLGRLTGESPLTVEEALGLGAPSPEEERKRSILRALKDLEYERSVGKVSDEDFAELAQRYRAEAKQLLQAIAEQDAPRRKQAERQLEERLRKEGFAAVTKKTRARAPMKTPAPVEPSKASSPPTKSDAADAADAPAPDTSVSPGATDDAPSAGAMDDLHTEGAAPEGAPSAAPVESRDAAPAGTVCAGCQTKNDVDARFCKRCGAALSQGEAS